MENENIKKGKKYLLIGVLVLFLAILGSSVAYYLARIQGSLSGSAAGTGLDLTITPLSTSANANGDLIPLDNDKETLTMAALGYGNETSNFDATKSCIDINGYSVCQLYKITLTNKGSAPVTVNGGVELTGANTPNIDCAKMNSSISVTDNTSCKGENTLASNQTITGGSSIDYYVIVYINNLDEPQTDKGIFNGTVTFTSTQGDQIKGRFKQESESEITLKSLGLTVDTEHTPNFATISGNNGVKVNMSTGDMKQNQGDGTNGLYSEEDDLGTSYYFRGAVTNNYVKFGNVLWRIVRINGDGTIRIALNQSIGKSAFNVNSNDNAYVGYMYGTPGSSTYDDTHANIHDSTIKTYLDTWYVANLQQYEDKIADAIYCNDRTVTKFSYNDYKEGERTFSGTGVGTEVTAYAGYKRIFIDHTPSLKCTNNNDKFTKGSTLGNGKITYSIGLLTLDEYQMVGAGSSDLATGDVYGYMDSTGAFYLYDSNNLYWSMTPVQQMNASSDDKQQMNASSAANVGAAGNEAGNVSYGLVGSHNGAVRPVVSLKSSSITGGTGTSADPFVVGGTNDTPICLSGEGC